MKDDRPPRRGDGYRVDRNGVSLRQRLTVLGEWRQQYAEVYSAYGCSEVTWHRAKKPREGLQAVGGLVGVASLDVVTHMTVQDWTPPSSLTSLSVGLRGRARGSTVQLGSLHDLEHLTMEGARVEGLSGLPKLASVELERSTWPVGCVGLPSLRYLTLKRVDPVDLSDWVVGGLRQLSVEEVDVSNWGALAAAPNLEQLHFGGTPDVLRSLGELPPLVNLRVLSCHFVIASGLDAASYPRLEYGHLSGEIAQVPAGWFRDSEGGVSNGLRTSEQATGSRCAERVPAGPHRDDR